MALTEYLKKRDFRSTPEPKGGTSVPRRRRFVIQKHDATTLHYDLRLEVDGVLVSWAVPKGPSLDPNDKRLAVHVEDHPLDYADFEGVIPKGNYGAGTVSVWDTGWWEPETNDPSTGLSQGRLSFTLHGEKLSGGWTLMRMRSRGESKEQWLLIKRSDSYAKAGETPITERRPASVRSGRTLEEIAEATSRPAVQRSRSDSVFPTGVRPQLCKLVAEAPRGENWIHEVKFDGYRFLASRQGGRVTLITRSGQDWTARFQPIVESLEGLAGGDLLIDGEAVILGDNGLTSFQALQRSIKHQQFDRLVFYAFDLLYADVEDLRMSRLLDRKARLAELIGSRQQGTVRLTEYIRGRGDLFHAEGCRLGLEGVISKRVNSVYSEGRSGSWVKAKCLHRQEFVVIGVTSPDGARKHFGSLLLAAHDAQGRLAYTGRVGTGFSEEDLADLASTLAPLHTDVCPAQIPPRDSEAADARWVEPRLVVEVKFTEWTEDRRLRHPVFEGLREDRKPKSVRLEQASMPQRDSAALVTFTPRSRQRQTSTRSGRQTSEVLGVPITHPDRRIFPEAGLTKAGLADYYAAVADVLLPYARGRPLSVVRCPQGIGGTCFFQKHGGDTFQDTVPTVSVPEDSGAAEYITVYRAQDLVRLAQFGVIELHAWGAPGQDVEHPDLVTFDLDPGEGVEWTQVVRLARDLRDRLSDLGLNTFAKLSGGKGIHVVAPLQRERGWDEVRSFCKSVASSMAREEPRFVTDKASKSGRTGKVFVDYLRNGRGATAVVPYSVRARPGAPCAVPVRWEELGRVHAADAYSPDKVRRRLASLKSEPWEGFDAAVSALLG